MSRLAAARAPRPIHFGLTRQTRGEKLAMASQLDIGLNAQLTWGLFRVKNAQPPGDGETGSGRVHPDEVQRRRHRHTSRLILARSKDLKLEDLIVVTIMFDVAASWVASWVKSRRPLEQARLLKHEQGHYRPRRAPRPGRTAWTTPEGTDGAAPEDLCPDGDALQNDVDAITQRFSPKSRPVQEKYDDDTDHGEKQPDQDTWNRLIRSAASEDMDPAATPGVSSPAAQKAAAYRCSPAAGISI